MSTVVGTCTDCIVSLPVQPTTALTFAVSVEEGFNLVRKHVAKINANYPATDITEIGVNLAPGGAYATGAVTAICIGTEKPVQVTLALAGNLYTLTVNRVLILDSPYDTVTVTNTNSSGDPIKVFVSAACLAA